MTAINEPELEEEFEELEANNPYRYESLRLTGRKAMSTPYSLETEVPGIGVIKAVRGGNPRDYLLVDKDGTVTWLDELAIKGIMENQDE